MKKIVICILCIILNTSTFQQRFDGELERDDNNVHYLHVNGVKKPVQKLHKFRLKEKEAT